MKKVVIVYPVVLAIILYLKQLILWFIEIQPQIKLEKKRRTSIENGEDCFDKCRNTQIKGGKDDPKIIKRRLIARYDNKLIEHNAV